MAKLVAVGLLVVVALVGCRRSAPASPGIAATSGADAGRWVEPTAPETPAPRGKHVALIYTSNVRGEYEHCGCPSHPLGGLKRRATLLDRAHAETDAVIHVDAGDLILPRPLRMPKAVGPDVGEMERRARLIFAGLARMGLAAFAPGDTDLVIGPKRLAALARAAKIPVVCANLVDAEGARLFPADRIVEAAGLKVGIFGLIEPPSDESARWKELGFLATDPQQAAVAAVASLRERGAQMVIGLFHLAGGLPSGRKIAAAVKGIDFVVLGHGASNLEMPERAGGSYLVEAFEMGKHLGRLDLHVVDGAFRFTDRGQRAQLITIAQDQRRQLADVRKRSAEDPSGQLKAYYDDRAKSLVEAIERNQRLVASMPSKVTGSWLENRIIPLDESIPDHPAVAVLVHQYVAENTRRADKGLPVGVAYTFASDGAGVRGAPRAHGAPVAPTPPEPPGSFTYAGTNACGACHQPAIAFWKKTKHAHAVASLKKHRRGKDPSCVGCHVTGFWRPGGTKNVRVALERFPEVGCESCHGPGLKHVTAENKKTGTERQVDEATCRGCHTPDQTNGEFDYLAFLKAVTGPGHGAPVGQ